MADSTLILRDLSDERRAAKTWLPASDKDVTEGRVVLREWEGRLYPSCLRHGALHRLTVVADIWRCGECGVGCTYEESPYVDASQTAIAARG